MNLEDVVLSEASQSQKDKRCTRPLTGGAQTSEAMRLKAEQGWGGAPLARGRGAPLLILGCTEITVHKMERAGRIVLVTIAGQRECT